MIKTKKKPSKQERADRYVDVDSTYVNAFLNLRFSPELLQLRILSRMTNACKEITKCMAVARALLRIMGEKRMDDPTIVCVVIEHAPKHALTGFLIGYMTKWRVIIVNPNSDYYKTLTLPKNIWCIKSRIENANLTVDKCDTLVVVTAHSIKGDFKAINCAWDKIEAKEKIAISLPLTAKMDCNGNLVKEYKDPLVTSISDVVRIWRPSVL